MKFSTREDIDAPIETVYARVTDFDTFERRMLRRGIDVTRDERFAEGSVGSRWKANFAWRGRRYDLDAELVALDPGVSYAIESSSNGIVCMGVVDLVALSKTRTRLFVSLELKPTTLSSRILMQSLRLAKGTLDRRFKARVAEFTGGIAG